MKTIVIRPEIIGYHNSVFREPRAPLNKSVIACAILLPLVALAGWAAGHFTASPRAHTAATPPAAVRPANEPVKSRLEAAPVASDGAVELQVAIDRGLVKAEFTGNGRDQTLAELSNPGVKPITVKVSFGQMIESGRNTVVVARTAQTAIAPGQCTAVPLPTSATRSVNRVTPGIYRLSAKTAPKIDLLLTYAQDHAELTPGALQTAVLALMENLPLSAVCKFAPAGADLPSHFDTSPFRAETLDILGALAALRDLGVRDRDLALTIDPQLKIEAMIDPVCRPVAMRYYAISSGTEWDYWKNELLNGDQGTRHYALFGIARFFPDVALEMMPKWAREKRTTQVFRLTSVQALAETKRPEALALLEQLVDELGRNTELGRAALEGAECLRSRLTRSVAATATVAFRSSASTAPF